VANTSPEASTVVDFWRAAGPQRWFEKDANFDRRFRERLLSLREVATLGELADWLVTPTGALALVLLLDQFPRNAFRGAPRTYASDAIARDVSAPNIGCDKAASACRALRQKNCISRRARRLSCSRCQSRPIPLPARKHRSPIRRQ
jgi:uncharacterized protein (DUF924 family)